MAAKSVSCDLGQPSSGAAAKPAVPSTASEAATADATAPADSTPGSKTKSTASLQREPSQRKTSQSAFLHRSKASVAHEVAGAAAAIERSRSAIHNPHPHHGACLDVGIETLDGSVLVHTPPPCMRNIWRHHDDDCDQDCGVAKDDCQQTHGADLQQASPRSPKHASRQRHQQHGTVSQFEAVEVFPRRQHLTGSTATPPPPPPPPPQAHPVQAKPSEPLSAAPLKQQTDAHQDGSCAARASQSLQNPPSKSKPDEPRPVAEDAARMPARGRSAEPASTADPSTVEYSHDAVERRAVKLRISSAFHRLPSARAASTRTPWSANDMHNESRSIKPNKPALPASGSGMAIINLGRIFGVNNLNPRVCQILNASRRDRSKTESREDWTKDGQTALPPPSVEYEHLGGSLDQDTLAMARQKTHQQHQQQQQEQSDELSGSVPDPSREILPPQSLLGRPIDNHHYTSSNSSDSDGRANTKAQPTIHQAERKSVQFVAGTFVSKDIHQRTHSASAQHSSPKPMALGSINTNNGRLQTSIITNSNSISLDPRHGAHSAAGLAYGNVEIDAVLSASPGSGGVQSGGASGVTSGSAPASTSRSAKTANPASASRDVSHIGMPDISAGAYDPLGDYPPSEPQTSVHFQQLRLHVEEPQPKPSTATVIFERLAERSRDHGVLERPLDMGLLNALNQAAKSAVGAGAWPNKLFGDTSNVAVSLLQVPVEARLQRVPSHISKLKSSPALATGTSNPSQYGAAVAAAVGISSQPSSAAGPAGSAQQSAIAGTDGAGTTLASSKAGVSLAVIEPRLRKGMWVIIRPLKKSKRRKGHSSGYAGSTAGRTETGASHNAAAQTAATSTPIPASLLASIVPVGCSGPGGGAFHPPLLPMHHHLTAVGPRTGSSARVRQDVKTMLARVQSKQQSAPQQQQTDLGALIRRSSARNSSIGKPSVAQGPSDRLVGSASANPGAGGRESLSKRSGSGSLLRLSLTQPAVSDGQKDTKAVTIDAPSSSARRASSRPWTHNAGLSRRAASLPSMGIDRNTDDDMLPQRPVHASHHYSTLRLRAVAPFAFDGPVAAATTGMGDRTFSRIARGDAEYHDEYVRDPKLISVTPGPWA
ncbi:hypothetical protein BC831DRAFT_260845 [Entophlyctis helioformis]|nr:hypothetical protein BC831DRAFT_260845 [Entophlyctis helioformis]